MDLPKHLLPIAALTAVAAIAAFLTQVLVFG
jgi:hypothetical protein